MRQLLDGDNQLSKNNFFNRASLFLLTVFGAVLWFGFAHPALADDGATVGDVLCYAFDNAKPFGEVFEWIAYICGIISAMKGVHHLKLHADSPANNKMNIGIMYLFGAMCLLALPSFIGALEHSLGYAVDSKGDFVCGEIGEVSEAEGLDQVVSNFVMNFKEPMISIVSVVAFLSGLFMVVSGLIKASKSGADPKNYSPHIILTHIGFGAILLTIGNMLPVVVASLFGTEDVAKESALSWTKLENLVGPDSDLTQFETAVTSALFFVQIIGVIAFVRGWLILKKVVEGSGNASLTQGLTHIIGGVFAINIFEFLRVMDRTFGTNLFG